MLRSRLMCLLLGVGTAWFSAWLNLAVDGWLEFDFALFFLFFIIPVGSMVLGTMGCVGGFIGVGLAKEQNGGFILLLMLFCSLMTFFLVHWLAYQPFSELVSFWQFMQITFTHMTPTIMTYEHHHGDEFKTGIELGGFGYVFLALQFLGFCLGPFLILGSLVSGAAKPQNPT
jgi:hypothetical protein